MPSLIVSMIKRNPPIFFLLFFLGAVCTWLMIGPVYEFLTSNLILPGWAWFIIGASGLVLLSKFGIRVFL